MMSCQSAKALRGNVEIFGILFRIVLRSTVPVFSFILFFQLHQKCPNFTRLVSSERRVKCKGSQLASTRRSALTISVLLNHTQRENNRSSFGTGTFFWPNLMLKLTSCRGSDGWNSRAGFGPRPDFADPWFIAFCLTFQRSSRANLMCNIIRLWILCYVLFNNSNLTSWLNSLLCANHRRRLLGDRPTAKKLWGRCPQVAPTSINRGFAIACRPYVRLSVCNVGYLWSHVGNLGN